MRRMSLLPNWMDVTGNAMELLCTIIRETPAVLISQPMAEKALANSIFEHMKRSPNWMWQPEDGKFSSIITNVS